MHRLLPRDAMQSAVMRLHVVCPSVWFSDRLEYFENNCTAEQIRVPVLTDTTRSGLVQRKHPQNGGRIRVGSDEAHKSHDFPCFL